MPFRQIIDAKLIFSFELLNNYYLCKLLKPTNR
jgi:hypothetical protein